MSLKQRVGNFFLLFGLIGLLVFAATVLTPPGDYNIPAFLVGALLFGVGLRFRFSKPTGPVHEAPHAAAPAHKAAAKGGPPKAGHPGGGPPHPAGAPSGGTVKRQGLLSGILKGPPPKKTAPAVVPPHAGGGPPKKR